MLQPALRQAITDLIKREVVPAMGCTEPAAVALCAAYAHRALQGAPARVDVLLSGNMLKNAMGVGIPGTGQSGLPIAVALGATRGNPERSLEVLADLSDDELAAARTLIADGAIHIALKEHAPHILYIEVTLTDAEGNTATAVIAGSHTQLVALERNGEPLMADARTALGADSADGGEAVPLTLHTVWEYATESPLDELRFILEARRMNRHVAEQSFLKSYGHAVGRTLHSERQRQLMGDSIFTRVLSYTSAAADARMAGAPLAVMSNSGSGNQGIAATLPVVVYADETFADEEHTIRALALSHLTVIYIKQQLGRLSALCGCVVAATGSACGICYLMGGGYEQVSATAKNMVANLTGMICDGAKPSCSMKLASGVSTAMMSAMMAMEGHCVTALEGIIDDDVDRTIRNLTRIGRDGMRHTDTLILDIMTGK